MSLIHLPHDHGQHIDITANAMPAIADCQLVADLFKQLGDGSRLRIFWLLCHCEECVINISTLVEMSSPAVSHHLKQLKSSGLIISRREGKEVYYQAAASAQVQHLHNILEQLMPIICLNARNNNK